MEKIYYITMDEGLEIVEEWEKNPQKNQNLYIAIGEEGAHVCGIDNTDGNCWVEEFKTSEEAKKWLLGLTSEQKDKSRYI